MGQAVKYRIGTWIACADNDTLTRDDGVRRKLERRAMETLILLAQNAGEVVKKDELIEAVWGRLAVSDHSVAMVISQLRRAFGDDARAPWPHLHGGEIEKAKAGERSIHGGMLAARPNRVQSPSAAQFRFGRVRQKPTMPASVLAAQTNFSTSTSGPALMSKMMNRRQPGMKTAPAISAKRKNWRLILA